jgi:hypothetical protein
MVATGLVTPALTGTRPGTHPGTQGIAPDETRIVRKIGGGFRRTLSPRFETTSSVETRASIGPAANWVVIRGRGFETISPNFSAQFRYSPPPGAGSRPRHCLAGTWTRPGCRLHPRWQGATTKKAGGRAGAPSLPSREIRGALPGKTGVFNTAEWEIRGCSHLAAIVRSRSALARSMPGLLGIATPGS